MNDGQNTASMAFWETDVSSDFISSVCFKHERIKSDFDRRSNVFRKFVTI